MSNYQLRMRSDQISGPVVLLRLFVTPVFVLCYPLNPTRVGLFQCLVLETYFVCVDHDPVYVKANCSMFFSERMQWLTMSHGQANGMPPRLAFSAPRLISFLWSGYRDGQVQIRGVPENSVLAIIHWCQTHINILIALS